jgi:lipopolysaccharide/colanic/teichoic acid biosynthesis glycosyltransferase
MSTAKRACDVIGASLGLVALLPLFMVVAAWIKLHDGGPVLFRQVRVGRHGDPFRMWKFRTMAIDAERRGGTLTVGDDPRITRVGRMLRSTRIDELPQLLNVLVGDMSLIGPRPEVLKYVDLYGPLERRVLELTPGMTDPASIKYRHESRILGQKADPELFYVNTVMPEKIRLNLEYASRATVWSDLLMVAKTVGSLLCRSRSDELCPNMQRRAEAQSTAADDHPPASQL